MTAPEHRFQTIADLRAALGDAEYDSIAEQARNEVREHAPTADAYIIARLQPILGGLLDETDAEQDAA